MKLGLMLPIGAGALGNERIARWPDLREMARLAEAIGFSTLFVPDHLLFRRAPHNALPVDMREGATRGVWEAWTVLAALAEATHRIELGPLVACSSFRNPALLAKMADTLDEISAGRLILGLGAGWHEPEYHAFGYPYDHRVGRFEEALQIIVPLLREGAVDFQGQYYSARECELAPRGPRPTGLPILIGAQRPRMLRLAARHADIYDSDYQLGTQEVTRRFAAVDEACADVGRDPATLRRFAGSRVAAVVPGDDVPPVDADGAMAFELGGMRMLARPGDTDALVEHVRAFARIGVENLTLALFHPAGSQGLERIAPVVEAIAADSG